MIFKIFRKVRNEADRYIRKRKYKGRILNTNGYTIISSNCMAGSIYKDFGLPFNSPTIGLFLCGSDFVKLASNLRYYLSLSVEEGEYSRWVGKTTYPLGIIDDIEIHFLHYDSFDDAKAKWERRALKVDFDRVYLIMTDRDFTTYEDIRKFSEIETYKKLCFVSKNYEEIPNTVFCQKYEADVQVGVLPLFMEYSQYFDVVSWLDD